MNRRPFVLALLLACVASAAPAQDRGAEERPAAAPRAVVELFTSQGCASCPPADALLTEMAKDPQIIALTLAVDYWDYIGWKDTLALHGHSERQKAYAEKRADRKIYTPQVVVDGTHPAKGSDRAAVQRAILAARSAAATLLVSMSLNRAGDALELAVDGGVPPGMEGAELWLCPVTKVQPVAIGRGENSGRQMTYSNVVRGWIRLGAWDGGRTRRTIPLSSVRLEGIDKVVVLLQAGSATKPGPILGATSLSLD